MTPKERCLARRGPVPRRTLGESAQQCKVKHRTGPSPGWGPRALWVGRRPRALCWVPRASQGWFLGPPRHEHNKAKQCKAKQCKAMQSNAKQCRECKAMQSEAKQSKAMQRKAKQSKAKQRNAKQSDAKQRNAKQSKAKQCKAKRCKAKQCKAK